MSIKQSRSQRRMEQERLLKIHKEVEQELKKIKGVISVGIGLKEVDNKLTDEICFRVYVKVKKPKNEISTKDLIPKEIRGVKTDVVLIEEEILISTDTSKYRPIKGGIQIGNNKNRSIGTLGCVATLNSDNSLVLLSNAHVIFDGPIKGDKIGQPNHSTCCCCTCYEIGTIEIGIDDNKVDCAIAKISNDISATNNIVDVGWIQGTDVAVLGDTVRKRGRTTRLTIGTIKDVNYDNSKNGQILIEANPPFAKFAYSGDSGSVIVNEENKVVGLLWAITAASAGKLGVANHIADVQAALDITIKDSQEESITIDIEEKCANSDAPLNPSRLYLEKFENKLSSTEYGSILLDDININRFEVLQLINNNREVKVAWNKYHGPEFISWFMKSIKDADYSVPKEVKGVSLHNLLLRMAVVLQENGSIQLVNTVNKHYLNIFNIAEKCECIDDIINVVRQTEKKSKSIEV